MPSSAGYGSVQPSYIVLAQHVLCHISLVYVHVLPLPALRLVAGDGIGIFYLQGAVVLVFLDRLEQVALVPEFRIVFAYFQE